MSDIERIISYLATLPDEQYESVIDRIDALRRESLKLNQERIKTPGKYNRNQIVNRDGVPFRIVRVIPPNEVIIEPVDPDALEKVYQVQEYHYGQWACETGTTHPLSYAEFILETGWISDGRNDEKIPRRIINTRSGKVITITDFDGE